MDTHDYITVNTFKEKEILHSDSPSPYATLKYSLPRDWGPAMDALKKEHIAPDLSRNVGGVWFYFSVDDRVLHAGCIRLSPSTVGYLYNAREVVRCNSEVISITIQPHGTNSTIKLANDGRIIADGIRLISPEVDDVFDWYFELTDQLLEEERNATT